MKFRKKPVEIEAMQFDGSFESYMAIAEWAKSHGSLNIRIREYGEDEQDHTHVVVNTLEGAMRGEPGDWIIRGVQGEFYPCKPDIFEATYEPAEARCEGCGEPDPDGPTDSDGREWCRACVDEGEPA